MDALYYRITVLGLDLGVLVRFADVGMSRQDICTVESSHLIEHVFPVGNILEAPYVAMLTYDYHLGSLVFNK